MTLTPGELLAIIIGLTALIFGIVAFLRANPQATPAALDAEVTRRLAELQADRPAIDRLERAYETSGEFQRQALDTLATTLATIAPYTGVKVDDALVKLLEDIRTRGEPPTAPPQGER